MVDVGLVEEKVRTLGVTYDFIAGAVPDIAGRDLTAATAVSLARDGSTVAGR